MMCRRWSCSRTITAAGRPARRGRAERARGRPLRRPGHRRGSRSPFEVAGRGPRSTGCATTTRRRRGADAPDRGRAPAPVLLVPPMMLAAEIYDVSPATSAVTLLHEPRRRPVGGRLRLARARGGRPGAHARRPRGRRSPTPSTASASSPAVTSTSAATRRAGCSATRSPPTARNDGHRLADHLRQPGRHPAGDAVRGARAVRLRPRRRCSPTGCSAAGRCPPGPAAPAFSCSIRSSRRAAGWSS